MPGGRIGVEDMTTHKLQTADFFTLPIKNEVHVSSHFFHSELPARRAKLV